VLSLIYTATPIPDVIWMKGDKKLKAKKNRVTIEVVDDQCILEVLGCSPDDAGDYTIEISNAAGSATAKASVMVKEAVVDEVIEKIAEEVAEKLAEEVLENVAEKVVEKVHGKAVENVAEVVESKVSEESSSEEESDSESEASSASSGDGDDADAKAGIPVINVVPENCTAIEGQPIRLVCSIAGLYDYACLG